MRLHDTIHLKLSWTLIEILIMLKAEENIWESKLVVKREGEFELSFQPLLVYQYVSSPYIIHIKFII